MKKKISMRRLIWLTLVAALIVTIGITSFHFFRKSPEFRMEEVLWVKKDGVFHARGSSLSRAVIDRLDPNYVEFDDMTFSGPVLLLYANLADGDTAFSRTPLVLLQPFEP